MNPAGSPAAPARSSKLLPPSNRTFWLLALPAIAVIAALALSLGGGNSVRAETASFLPTAAGCSNSEETDDTPAACSASGGTLAPGGGAAIVESDNTGESQGDDDLQVVYDLSSVDADRVLGASFQIGSSQSGSAGTIQIGGPNISDTNYGSVPTSGGTATTGALVSAVEAAAGGQFTAWLQVACSTASNDCGAAIDSVRLNVELEDQTPAVSLVVSSNSNRSGAQALAGASLDGNVYIYVTPSNGINQVRFFLDDPGRSNAVQVENQDPFDFQGGTQSDANPWNSDSVSDGSHTVAAEVDFSNGTSTVLSATFSTGAPAPDPAPGSPTLLVSSSANRSNSVSLDGATLTELAYIHVSPSDGITQARFYLDDSARSTADSVENITPFDFQGGSIASANPWNPDSVSDGAHTLAVEVDFDNGSTSVLTANFSTGTSTPPPSSTPDYDLYVSLSSDRSNPALLDGQEFDDRIYVFVLSDEGINQARFWVDDRGRNGPADQVENVVPWDLAGGSQTQAGAFDVTALGEGTHWITAELDVDGGTEVIEGSFNVPAGTAGGGGGGVPIPPGAIRINPGQSIQAAVNQNPSGTTFVIGSGVHRMQSVQPKSGNTFIGESGAILNGSRVLTNWNSAGGGQYYAANQTQEVEPHGGCVWEGSYPGKGRCRYAEQVFVNGQPLLQVLNRWEVTASSFYFDYGANRIYIGQSPSGKFIEASVQQMAFSGSASNVTVSGLIVEKYSTPAQKGAIHSGYGWTVSNNETRYNHGYGIRATSNTRILDNYSHHNGEMGIGGSGNDILIQGNEVAYNHTEDFLVDWEAGGMKFAAANGLVFRDNYVHHNDGRGIWTDLDVINALVEDNVVESNDYEGIKHEIGYAIVIRNNLVRFNGINHDNWLWGAQILIQNSRDGQVYGNEVWVSASGGDGIGIADQNNRGSGRYGAHVSSNNHIHHNEVHVLGTRGDNGQNCSATYRGNTFDHNTYYGSSYYFNSVGRFMTCDWNTWDQWRQEGYEPNGNRVITN